MNKERREELLEVVDLLEDAANRLSEIRDDEQDAFDSMPDGLQSSIRGDAMQEAIDKMDEFGDAILNLQNSIEQFAKPKKKKK